MVNKNNITSALKSLFNFAINSIPATPNGVSVPATAPGNVGQRPFTNKAGLLKLFLVSFSSLYLGGLIAHKGASYLEENEIFVPTEDDDDD